MRRPFGTVIGPAVAAVAVAVLPGCAGPARADVALVSMTDDEFNPATIVVPAGTEVRWVNDAPASHTVTSDDWDSGRVRAGGTFTRRFDQQGLYTYWCTDHREAQMLGTVRVEPGS